MNEFLSQTKNFPTEQDTKLEFIRENTKKIVNFTGKINPNKSKKKRKKKIKYEGELKIFDCHRCNGTVGIFEEGPRKRLSNHKHNFALKEIIQEK